MADRYSEQAGLEVVSVPPSQPPEKLVQDLQHPSNDPAFSSPIPVPSYPGPPLPPPPVNSAYAQQGYEGSGGEGGYGGHPQFGGAGGLPPAPPEKKIFGLKKWVFTVIVIAAIVIIVAAVGGGVGGALASKNNNNNSSAASSGDQTTTTSTTSSGSPTGTTTSSSSTSTSAPPLAPTPGTFAAVKSSDPNKENYNSITYFYQDIHSPDIYMWTIIKGYGWISRGKLEGLDPPPRANSSIAAVQAPDEDTVSLFYTAENGTLFDAVGSATDPDWRMGYLAPRTNYAVLVSEGSGIGATWWGNKGDNGPGYRIRVYYVDSAAARVRELAFDPNKDPQWFITDQALETCARQAKIAIAHLTPENRTSTIRETAHLFFQNRDGNLRHLPGYDGTWDSDNAETIVEPSLPDNAFLSASIHIDERRNHTIRLWYLDNSSRLNIMTGLGQSKKAVPSFDNLGTFDGADLVASTTTSYISLGQVGGGSLAAVGWNEGSEEVRIYYRANIRGNNGKNGAVEIAGMNGWASKVLEVEEES